MNKETLKNFAINEDYAFCINAGISYANDNETREAIAEIIDKASDIEVSNCADLAEEVANGCTIYKVAAQDNTPLYIAYYE